MDMDKLAEECRLYKEMLSFLTHSFGNSLSSVDYSIKEIINKVKDLTVQEEKDKFEIIYALQSLSTVYSINNNTLQSFKQIVSRPKEFMEDWQKDNEGAQNISSVLDLALQQAVNRLFIHLSNEEILKFYKNLSYDECDLLRKQFIYEVVLSRHNQNQKISLCMDWLKKYFDIFDIDIQDDTIMFAFNGKRFNFFFSTFSEILFNAVRYATEKPIQLRWLKQNDDYCFICTNRYNPATRHYKNNSKRGLSSIKQVLSLLGQAELSIQDQNSEFTTILKINQGVLI